MDEDKLIRLFNSDESSDQKTSMSEECPNCKSTKIIENSAQGIVECGDCGQVITKLIDHSPEWKNYENNKDTVERCGIINELLPQSSLGTTISGNYRSKLCRMNQWNSMPYKERSLNNVFKIIQKICLSNNIFKCIENDAKIMYKMISECKHKIGKNKGKFIISRGINRISIISACLYFACRKKSMALTAKEIANMFEIKTIDVNKGCKKFIKLMRIKYSDIEDFIGNCHIEHFVLRKCKEINLKQLYIDQSINIAKNIEKYNIGSSHTPYSLAAASILMVAVNNKLLSIDKKQLSHIFNISEMTILKAFKQLSLYKHILIDNKLTINSDTSILTPAILNQMKKFNIKPSSELIITETYNKIIHNNTYINSFMMRPIKN